MVLSFDRWVGKVAVVTGTSSGIGAAITEQLVEKGMIVAGLARRIDRVEEQSKKLSDKKGKLYPIQCDIAKEEEVLKAFNWVEENLGPVHILVNNAGLSQDTNLIDGDTEKWQRIFYTNVLALCVCTREAVRQMKAANVDGHIIHINAVLGHTVVNIPNLNVYPASKFSVTALAETLRKEMNATKSKIKVTNLSPGKVDTEFRIAAGRIGPEYEKYANSYKGLASDDVAHAVVYVLSTPPHVQIQELMITPLEHPH